MFTLKKLQALIFGFMFMSINIVLAQDNAIERVTEGNQDDEQPLIIDKSIPGNVDEPVNNNRQSGPPTAGNTGRSKSVLNSKSGKLLDILSRINQLETENRQLRGEIEVLTHDLKSIKQRQRELYIDVDGRMRKLELKTGTASPSSALSNSGSSNSNASITPVPGNNPPQGKPPVNSQGDAGDSSASESQDYKRAFAQLRSGHYKRAIISFRRFLKKHPKGQYADTAQYWLAEALFVSRKYKSSIAEYRKLVKNHPNSLKVVSSKLKMGLAYYEIKQVAKAKRILRGVIKNYPKSDSAKLAKARLRSMK